MRYKTVHYDSGIEEHFANVTRKNGEIYCSCPLNWTHECFFHSFSDKLVIFSMTLAFPNVHSRKWLKWSDIRHEQNTHGKEFTFSPIGIPSVPIRTLFAFDRNRVEILTFFRLTPDHELIHINVF